MSSVGSRKAVALFSGGLDSMLAVRVLQQQGFEVEALNVRTIFQCCKAPAARAAAQLGVRLTVLGVGDDYLDLLRNPRHGYGKGCNPCVDCRAYMGRLAGRLMEESGACVVISGEVVGQRPNSQKRQQLGVVARDAGLEGRLLRPLSAKLLPPTIPEIEGLVDRRSLYGFHGRGRRPLIELATRLGIREIPTPSTGCALAEKNFSPRVKDLFEHQPAARRWEFELLNTGRHFRFDRKTKMVVGRNERENALLERVFQQAASGEVMMVEPADFVGPVGLLVGPAGDTTINSLAALLVRYTRQCDPDRASVRVWRGGQCHVRRARLAEAVQPASRL